MENASYRYYSRYVPWLPELFFIFTERQQIRCEERGDDDVGICVCVSVDDTLHLRFGCSTR